MTSHGETFKFAIEPLFGRDRTEFFGHPDGGQRGSNGCVVPDQSDSSAPRRIRSCLQNLVIYGVQSMNLNVYYSRGA